MLNSASKMTLSTAKQSNACNQNAKKQKSDVVCDKAAEGQKGLVSFAEKKAAKKTGKFAVFRARELERSRAVEKNITKFYSDPKNFDELYEILSKKAKISLRALEYVASNEICWKNDPFKAGLYQDSRDSCSKLLFDSFRRHTSFTFTEPNGERQVNSNLAQLSFLKFSIENGVVSFLKDPKNLQKIEIQMKNLKKKTKRSTGLPGSGVESAKKRRRKKKIISCVGAANLSLGL